MKNLRKLIPAFAMLLVAAVLLGSSTFAWFSMNTTVTATSMSVTAKSDQTFMLIKAGHAADAAAVQASKKTEDDALNVSAELLPTAHTATVTNISTADAPENWFYKTSDDPSLYGGDGHESAATALTALTGYVLVNEFSVSLAAGANPMSNIKVGTCTLTTSGDAAVKVLVATATASEEFGATGSGSTTLQASLTDSTVMYVRIYIYWDGADSDVYTNGIADLQNTSVVVTFTGTVVNS